MGDADARALGAGVLAVLRDAAPLLLAIDDVPWLDAPSAEVLAFALRRLDDVELGLLLARRGGGPAPLGLDADRLRIVELGPLRLRPLHQVLRERVGWSLSRPLLRRMHAASGGNPLYATELCRALQRRGADPSSTEPLPVPDGLQALVEERCEALARPVQRVLALAASLLDPSLEALEAASRAEGLGDAIDGAVHAGVLEVDGRRLRFGHPILAASVLARLGPQQRRSVHETLAQTAGPDERPVHLGLIAEPPDEPTAATLEAAARRAPADLARRLAERAAELTPPDAGDDLGRRLVLAAERVATVGDPGHARVLLERAVACQEAGPGRAAALSGLAWVTDDPRTLPHAVRLLEQALGEAAGDVPLEARIRLRLWLVVGILGQEDEAREHAEAAARLAAETADAELEALALAAVGYSASMAGDGVAPASFRAAELERELPGFLGAGSPTTTLGRVLLYADRVDEARPLLEAQLDRATAAGDEEARADLRFHLADLEFRAGRWDVAEGHAERSRALFLHAGKPQAHAASLTLGARLAALRGRLDEARELSREGLDAAERMGDRIFAVHHRGVLGVCDLLAGDPAAAHAQLGTATAEVRALGVRELSLYPVLPYELDALLALGELDEAEGLVGWLEEVGGATGRAWTLGLAGRGRALLRAAQGDTAGAREAIAGALDAHASAGPFELARTQLAAGEIERRARQKRAVRELLEPALATFEQLGAQPYAERTRAALARLGVRGAPTDGLSETERRVATLAADGLTNRQIAAAVFLSEKTVEGNLSRVYAKLQIRSRVELARALERQPAGVQENAPDVRMQEPRSGTA